MKSLKQITFLSLGIAALNWSSLTLAATPIGHDPDLTPDTIIHQSGCHSPVQSADATPFQADPLTASRLPLPRVNNPDQVTAAALPEVSTDTDNLISYWGRSI